LPFLQVALRERLDPDNLRNPEVINENTKLMLKRLTRFQKIVKLWAKDNVFVIEQLKELNNKRHFFFYNRLDMERIGIFGQSIGGAAAGQVCLIDSTVKAGINIDCFQFGDMYHQNMETPFMLIESENHREWNIGNTEIFSKKESDFYRLKLKRGMHYLTTDAALMTIFSAEQFERFVGKVDAKKNVELIVNYIVAFFNYHLKNITSDFLLENVDNEDVSYQVRRKN
jgi:hypothetical protein